MFYKKIVLLSSVLYYLTASAQTGQVSIIQEQSIEYSKYNFSSDQQWDSLYAAQNPGSTRKIMQKQRSNCTLNKVVYGWNPYWNGTTYLNYQWNLLSHLCHFAYEVDYTDGSAISTHSWATDDAVDSALANGVKVDLCVTLFSNHATFLGNSTAKQTLITNLINLVQSRGANGVNIDFEGLPSAQSANFTSFMIDLCTQMHTAIPGSQVSICLYSVDWSNVFDETSLNPYVDMFIIMGYDYYYSGSSIAGPTDPLYNFLTSYNYTLTKSITYYLNQGITLSKLILGLPYYGKQWATTDNSVGSATTATGTSPFYKTVRANTSGYYSNKLWNETSYTPYYTFQNSGWYQCWIDDAYSLGKRFDMVNQRGIGGIGIWALGYDDGYTELWDKLTDKFSSCSTVQCVDTIYDMGGPQRNYYDNENYTYTIKPDGASAVSLAFNSFSVANDTLWLYNGPNTSSTLTGAYTSTNSPGTVTSSGNSFTVKFCSHASTNSTGWDAIWQCIIDNIAPATVINVAGNWQTQNFTANFTDTDNPGGSGIEKRFYGVSDFNGTEWTANAQNGFFNDDFNSLNTSVWTVPSGGGTWQATGGNLVQKDTTVSNSNIYAALNQNLSNRYIYHFNAKIENAVYGTNQRRFGIHFFSDTASQTNRGNSYFIYFRQETNKLEFYKVVNNTFTQTKVVDNVITIPGQWYDFKVFYDRTTGKIDVYRDNIFLGSWTDTSPLTTAGNYISFRTGNCKATIDDIKVYRSRNPSAIVSVGPAATNDMRYQNPDPATDAGRIYSIVNDSVGNLSAIDTENIGIDWTPPAAVASVNDGLSADIDTTNIVSSISANWNNSVDPNSGISYYFYCFGTSPGAADLIGWTNNGTDTSVTMSGFTLLNGQIYYCSVYAKNGAGLISDTIVSDGVTIIYPPVAGFYSLDTAICAGDTVNFTNTSSNAITYYWNFPGGNPSVSTDMNPQIIYDSAGIYNVELLASGIGGSDTLLQTSYINVYPSAHANFSVYDTLVYLPTAIVIFLNTSTDAASYFWDFGDGNTSTDLNPWHSYDTTGVYTVTLIAYNSQCGNDTLIHTNLIYVITSVGINEHPIINGISVFPNPTSGNILITFNLQEDEAVEISLVDKTGKQLIVLPKKKMLQGSNKIKIDTEKFKLSSGSYLLRITSNNKSYCSEIIIL